MTSSRRHRLTVARYRAAEAAQWDVFVDSSKNGTFLLRRGYMDYHADRFDDFSLVVRYDNELAAVLPAHRNGDTVYSHNGLSYGGFVTTDRMTTPLMLDIFAACRTFLAAADCRALMYKTIPHIYHRQPAEEDRYALFRDNAVLYRRDLLSTIDMACRLPAQTRRRRGATKAANAGVVVAEFAHWPAFWKLLTAHLAERYGVSPIHSLEEILLLRGRFPDSIRLFTATLGGEIIGGVVIYQTEIVAHLQYAAASSAGFAIGGLDRLFFYLLDEVYRDRRWFDFGNSTEQQGRYLNDGLIDQKEGFGGRAVSHDFYQLDL